MNGLTLGSLFDGIGGFPLAAQRCGIRALWASEIEPNCIAITKRHFPEMQHLGSITEIDGGKIPPVDIISFGSPCQDLSVAGKQSGLDGERSGLFREAVRIIYEMREATNGIYPTFIIWENVPGAFGSNKGKDFRTVLEEITKARISMPDSRRWAKAGMVRIGGVDIAWRQMDAQHWGIPQRRKRIFLVADFRGRRAAEILFKPESLIGYSETGAEAKPGIAAAIGSGAEISGRNFRCAADALQCTYETAHASEAIRVNKGGICPTLQARMGTGGNQIPLVLDLEDSKNIVLDDGGGKFVDVYTNGICSTLRAQTKGHLPCVISCQPINMQVATRHNRLGENTGLGIAEDGDPAYTLQAAHSHAVFACYPVNEAVIHGKANGFGIGEDGDPAPTLTGRDRHAVAFFAKARFDLFTSSKTAATILATTSKNIDGILLEAEKFKLFIRFILRKLTPLECERLQEFPDEWTRYSDTGEEIKDTPRYVALGNSLAVPCAERVFRGIISAIGGGPGIESR